MEESENPDEVITEDHSEEPPSIPPVPETDVELSDETPDEDPNSPVDSIPDSIKDEIRSVLSYMDKLLEALPDDKIEEFAKSEHFAVYQKLFDDLGLTEE